MWRNLHKNEGKMERTTVVNPMSGPVWKVCIARRISLARNFDAFYIFTIKFSKSLARNFQTFQSGEWQHSPPDE